METPLQFNSFLHKHASPTKSLPLIPSDPSFTHVPTTSTVDNGFVPSTTFIKLPAFAQMPHFDPAALAQLTTQTHSTTSPPPQQTKPKSSSSKSELKSNSSSKPTDEIEISENDDKELATATQPAEHNSHSPIIVPVPIAVYQPMGLLQPVQHPVRALQASQPKPKFNLRKKNREQKYTFTARPLGDETSFGSLDIGTIASITHSLGLADPSSKPKHTSNSQTFSIQWNRSSDKDSW